MTGSAFQQKIDQHHEWWKANEGKQPGFHDKPDPATQVRLKPRDPLGW